MSGDFDAAVAPFRRELLAHCYRMTGSVSDAEDALQESLVRAWKGFAGFEGRSSLRTWLHRVATNTCLNFVSDRRVRSLPHASRPVGKPDDGFTPDLEPVWVEPFPDTAIEDDPRDRPDAVFTRRQAVRLAFIVALQRLPARQRAVLILRDVVALSAEETAEILELTVAACNSLLQRARESMNLEATVEVDRESLRGRLARYVTAWETGDAGILISLLRADAIASMPPSPLWVIGAQNVVDCMKRLVWTGPAIRLVACDASAAPSYGVYQERDGIMAFAAISVLDIRDDGIASIHSFLAIDPRLQAARYGLPEAL